MAPTILGLVLFAGVACSLANGAYRLVCWFSWRGNEQYRQLREVRRYNRRFERSAMQWLALERAGVAERQDGTTARIWLMRSRAAQDELVALLDKTARDAERNGVAVPTSLGVKRAGLHVVDPPKGAA